MGDKNIIEKCIDNTRKSVHVNKVNIIYNPNTFNVFLELLKKGNDFTLCI